MDQYVCTCEHVSLVILLLVAILSVHMSGVPDQASLVYN